MKKLACIYTAGGGMPQTIENVFQKELGDVRFVHITDSSLMHDLMEAGEINEELDRRLMKLFDAAAALEPDLILCTCSSIGEAAERAQTLHPEVKILRIDEAMALQAAENYRKVGLLATVETTLGPSGRLVERLAADAGNEVSVVSTVAAEAFPLLLQGKPERALPLILEKAKALRREADVVLLAQASMGAFEQAIREATGLPVFVSPPLCAAQVKEMFR